MQEIALHSRLDEASGVSKINLSDFLIEMSLRGNLEMMTGAGLAALLQTQSFPLWTRSAWANFFCKAALLQGSSKAFISTFVDYYETNT